MPQVPDLPDDIEALTSIVLEHSAVLAERSTKLEAAEAMTQDCKGERPSMRCYLGMSRRSWLRLGLLYKDDVSDESRS